VKAAEFLDAGAQAHEKENNCISCHGTFAYLMARPALSTPAAQQAAVRSYLEKWVTDSSAQRLNDASDPQKLTEAVFTGAVLAQHDAATSGKLQPISRQSLDLMWQVQQKDGGFNWLKSNNEPPSSIDDHFGVTMAAIGAGLAPGGYADTPATRAGLEKIRVYLHTHQPDHLHQRAMLLLADHCIGGLLTEDSRRQTVTDLFALQRPDGGWAMASLGNGTWKRKDHSSQDLTTSDGYGTGFSVYVLRFSGEVPADDVRIRKAITWLKTHQRASGYWYTRAPKNSDEISSYVGSAYAVLALKACGEIP
jgi:squalene-hopene/tetraprenyl-beta-curcumene cyclase